MIGDPIGALALYLMFGWLLCAIITGYLSNRKGYGERPGLVTAMLLFPLGLLIWLFWPAKEDSVWKREGPLPRRRA